MDFDSEMLISILKLTKEGPVSHEVVNTALQFPSGVIRELLQRLQDHALISVHDNTLEVNGAQRLRLAVQALKMGGDIEKVSSLLRWKEFEGMAGVAFEQNGYLVRKNLHFKREGRKWEIDIIGFKKPLVVCVDCKHWHHGLYPSVLERIVEEQITRVRALTKAYPHPEINVAGGFWRSAKFVPVIVSLFADESKFHKGVPVVPILQLQDFLNQLPAHADTLFYLRSTGPDNSSLNQKRLF